VLEGEVSANDPLVSVVDDDASMRNSTCRLIRSFGIRAEAFASAREFLDSGRVESTVCLILDVRMPGMSGLELQRELTEFGHHFPIIFVTAHATDAADAQAMQAGASDFLPKPVSEHALIHAIEVALRRKFQDGAERHSSGTKQAQPANAQVIPDELKVRIKKQDYDNDYLYGKRRGAFTIAALALQMGAGRG
jgi:FixJ family two-component response regulator